MEGERVVFTEEANPQRYVKLVAAGEIDETLLDAIAEYVERQRKRLERASSALSPETSQRRRLREEEEQE